MRTILFVLLAVVLSTGFAKAQIPGVNKDAVLSTANAGKLLTQLTDAIKPTSFTDAWSGEKEGFLSMAGKISDAASIASTVSSLAGFIKPILFKDGVSAGSLSKTASTVKTVSQAASLLKTFEGGLKPEALLSSWSGQRSGWLSALSLLK